MFLSCVPSGISILGVVLDALVFEVVFGFFLLLGRLVVR